MNEFNMSYQPVAVVMEGSFQSAYLNRLPPSDVQIRPDDILLKSASTKMMVVANGEIPKNEVQRVGNNQRIYPLGYDKVMGKVAYGNKDFVLNAVNYLTDETGMLTLRNRSIPMRLLDKKQANEKRYIWQIINLLIPIVLLFVLYSVNAFIRKRKFADKM